MLEKFYSKRCLHCSCLHRVPWSSTFMVLIFCFLLTSSLGHLQFSLFPSEIRQLLSFGQAYFSSFPLVIKHSCLCNLITKPLGQFLFHYKVYIVASSLHLNCWFVECGLLCGFMQLPSNYNKCVSSYCFCSWQYQAPAVMH